ncbi:AAA family ATPase [Streptomyces sp. NPDC127084]|uniref:AAA family ATPase n=1 Tax=Streptomyces sp. NPDC127084 TaxID=3347133 RepID=UPI00364D9F15
MSDEPGQALRARLVGRWPFVGRASELDDFDRFMSDRRMNGFFIHGRAGVGKSRLADECLLHVAASGCATGRATATSAAAAVPLGAIAHLLPDDVELSDPVAGFAATSQSFRERYYETGRLFLLVDNVQFLDTASAMLLRQLMDANAVFLVGTVRTGEPHGDAVEGLSGGDAVHRVDLYELSPPQVQALLEGALGGSVASHAVRYLHSASGGNTLFLRELVLGAATAGTLVYDGELWDVSVPRSTSTRRLTDLIRARLAGTSSRGRRVLDTLALCEPLSTATLAEEGNLPAVDELEKAGLILVGREQRRISARLAHPLYGEVLREDMSMVRRQQTLLQHIAVVERHGARRREDALRLATHRLAATGHADPELLVQAAALATHAGEYSRALSLLHAVPEGRHTVRSRLLMGKSLFETGEAGEAEHWLALADAEAHGEEEALAVTLLRTRNLMWGLGSPPALLASVLESCRSRVTSAAGRFRTGGQRGFLRMGRR